MLTLAICTHDRIGRLEKVLDSATRQIDPGVEWELLVIANGCRDGTVRRLEELSGRLPLRVVEEERLGLSHARNRALRECRSDSLIFTDDDVELDNSFVAAYLAAFRREHAADFFAGRVLARWDSPPPRWFRPESLTLLSGIFVQYDLGSEDRPLGPQEPLPIGASFALRRPLFERLGEFRADLGVSGREPGRGEETEYLGRALETGAHGHYVGRAVCWHPVDPARFTPAALVRHGVASGVAHRRIRAPGANGSYFRGGLFVVRGLVQLARGRGDRFRQCLVNCGIEIGLRRAARVAGA